MKISASNFLKNNTHLTTKITICTVVYVDGNIGNLKLLVMSVIADIAKAILVEHKIW
jgi:hypothetical protein